MNFEKKINKTSLFCVLSMFVYKNISVIEFDMDHVKKHLTGLSVLWAGYTVTTSIK